jgi:hypothetical protein
VHLLKREAECKEAFRRIAGKTSRETVATERGDLGSIGRECRFHGIELRRTPVVVFDVAPEFEREMSRVIQASYVSPTIFRAMKENEMGCQGGP